jgi:O-antigen ligase
LLKSSIHNPSGQSTFQLIGPLLITLTLGLTIFYFMPRMSAVTTIALAGGILFFVISFASTQIALYILIFSMLLGPEVVVGATMGATLGRGVTLRLDDLILVIIGFSWLARMSVYKELGFFLRTPLNRPIATYITVCLLSTFLAALFGRVSLKTGFFFVLKYFEYMVIYFMVANHLHDKKQVHHFLWALLLTCVIVSFIGMTQIPGEGRVSAPFEGEAGEPNTFGGYLLFMMAIALGLVLTSNLWRDRLVFGSIAVIAFIPFLYTQSRASYLAFFPMLAVFVWLSEKRKVVMLFVLFVAALLPLAAPQVVKDRVTYTFTQRYHPGQHVEIKDVRLDTSTSARLRSWKDALQDFPRHPVMGFGVTGYSFIDAQFPRVLLETGLVGMIVFLLLLLAVFKQGITVFEQADDLLHKGISMGFLAGYAGLLVHAIGSNTFIIVRIMEPFWFVAGMVAMIPELESKVTQDEIS